jgi:hypothetical protein
MLYKMKQDLLNEHQTYTYTYEYRLHKMNKYIDKRTDVLDSITYNLPITIPTTVLITWYDLFYDYAKMGLLDESTYWKLMKKLKNPFAQWNTSIHSILFSIYCTSHTHKINITEFLVSLLIFSDHTKYFMDTLNKIFEEVFNLLHIAPNFILDDDILFYIKNTNDIHKITSDKLNRLYNNRMEHPDLYKLVFKTFIKLNKVL